MTKQDSLMRSLAGTSAFALAVTLAVIFWPALLGKVFLYGDLAIAHLPTRMFYSQNLASGLPSLWLPNLFCGFYLHGEGQVGMYHPLHWLLYKFLPLSAAFNLECALSYPLAFAGTALFLRRLRLPTGAAMFGGTSFAFCGFVLVRMTHLNMVAVLAHIPWLLWLIDIALRDPPGPTRERALVGITLMRGSQLLLGHPGAIYLSLLCEGLYALPIIVAQRRALPVLWLGFANLLGVGLGAAQLIPTIQHFSDSLRASTSFEYLTALSLHPLSLFQPLAPYLFRDRAYQTGMPNPVEQVFYLGAVVPVAVVWVLVRRKHLKSMQPLLLGALTASVLAIGLALGKYNPAYWIMTELPFVGQLRVPSRYALIVFLASAVVVAVGYMDLLHVATTRRPVERRRSWWVWLAPLVSALIAAGALGMRVVASPDGIANLGPVSGILLGPLLSMVAAGLWFAAARGRQLALVGLILFGVADQAVYGASLWWSVPPMTVSDFVARVGKPQLKPGHRLRDNSTVQVGRNASGQVVFGATTPFIVHGTRLVHGYAGLMPQRKLDYNKHPAMQVAGVSAAIVNGQLVQIPGALERFRFVSRVLASDRPATAIETIDVATTAIVEVPVDPVPGPAGTVRVREDTPGRMVLMTRSTTRQFLVISESHHVGWKLEIDGMREDLVRTYGDFMGVLVEPGSHEIVLRFDPDSLRTGGTVSGVSAGLLALVALWVTQREAASRRRPRAAGRASEPC